METYFLFGWNESLHKKNEPCSSMLAQGERKFIEEYLEKHTVIKPKVFQGRELTLKTTIYIQD